MSLLVRSSRVVEACVLPASLLQFLDRLHRLDMLLVHFAFQALHCLLLLLHLCLHVGLHLDVALHHLLVFLQYVITHLGEPGLLLLLDTSR